MPNSILPNEESNTNQTPAEILKYVNPDVLRLMLRNERLRWNLKPNKDMDYYGNQTSHKMSSDLHNEGVYMRMELRKFPDNDALPGYAGVNIDSGEFGIEHDLDKWDHAISAESLRQTIHRVQIGASARITNKVGYGLLDDHMTTETSNRMASMIFDPYDGRAYLMSNDDPAYVNNEHRAPSTKLPRRTVARIGDIPTRITDLKNDLDFVSDPDYRHTDNNFTNSHKFLLDNLDDRTFVYPEISKKSNGQYVDSMRIGLDGTNGYAEADGHSKHNTQPDPHGDRNGAAINSYNANKRYSGVNNPPGYIPGIFKSLEELEKVDLVDQRRSIRTNQTPGAKRSENYYIFDGVWSPNWFDRYMYNDSYLSQSINPSNMELRIPDREPVPFAQVDQTGVIYKSADLYQWRYNRISLKYYAKDIIISIEEAGEEYQEGDVLRWSFGDDVFLYRVTRVGTIGQIHRGEYICNDPERVFEQDPSTHGVGVRFTNMSDVGRNAKLSIQCNVTIETHATQIKNNLYAYVDVVPTVPSDNTTPWSDVNEPSTQEGRVVVRSTAGYPAYTGINSGRGGPTPNPGVSDTPFYEHGGNATAGMHVHLFRYVIDTQNPKWVVRDGVQVFLGQWVDQGPMGLERASDIKALLFSNPDVNNFSNLYKFSTDILLDTINRNPDATMTNNPNAVSIPYLHIAQRDPTSDQRFTTQVIDQETSEINTVDITEKVIYINAATGRHFMYNASLKNDPEFGYGLRPIGWYALSGSITR